MTVQLTLIHQDVSLVLRQGSGYCSNIIIKYDRMAQKGAETEYAYSGNPVTKAPSVAAPLKWEISVLADASTRDLIQVISKASHDKMFRQPYTGYEITLLDEVRTIESETPRARDRVGEYEEPIVGAPGWVKFYGQFKVVMPLNEVKEEMAKKFYRINFVLYEAT